MDLSIKPWRLKQLYNAVGGRKLTVPAQQTRLSNQVVDYEDQLRQLWLNSKPLLLVGTMLPIEFAEQAAALAEETWPDAVADVLGIDPEEFTAEQLGTVEVAQAENRSFLEDSLAPDLAKALAAGVTNLDNFDHRVIFLYAGALWSLGSLATVMFDGVNARDLADVFIFVGPNDERTCTGPRGCDQHVNKVYVVAQILAGDIIPGRLACYGNCRHVLVPMLSLPEEERQKHLPGKYDQREYTPLEVVHGSNSE